MKLREKVLNCARQWDSFWFSPVSLLNLAVFRFVFCLTMALMYVSRQKDVELFYTDQGLLPKAQALQVLFESVRPPFLLSFWPDSAVPAVHALLIVLLFLLAFGVVGRLGALVAAYLQLAFLYRNYGVAFGADQIGSIFLLYLAFTKSQARLSVQAWWRKRNGRSPLLGDALTSVFYRLIQIQLCIIYVYSGMEKLKGATWWDGTAVWSVLANPQMVIADFTWIRHVPLVVAFISFSTILFEVYFPVLVWIPRIRKHCLWAGVFFHAGIGIVMALWSFAIVMISSYILFVPADHSECYWQRVRLKMERFRKARL